MLSKLLIAAAHLLSATFLTFYLLDCLSKEEDEKEKLFEEKRVKHAAIETDFEERKKQQKMIIE